MDPARLFGMLVVIADGGPLPPYDDEGRCVGIGGWWFDDRELDRIEAVASARDIWLEKLAERRSPLEAPRWRVGKLRELSMDSRRPVVVPPLPTCRRM